MLPTGRELDDRLLTAEELADYLRIPMATLYQQRYRGEGPRAIKVGGRLRYRWADVVAWLEQAADRV